MNWTIEKVTRQAVVLYEGQRSDAEEAGNLQAEQFWESHRNTALYALRGVDTPVSDEEVAAFVERWNNEPDDDDRVGCADRERRQMTHDEMIAGLEAQVENARQHVATVCGRPLVVTLEAMGYRVVPAWVPASLVKVLKGPTDKEAEQRQGPAKGEP